MALIIFLKSVHNLFENLKHSLKSPFKCDARTDRHPQNPRRKTLLKAFFHSVILFLLTETTALAIPFKFVQPKGRGLNMITSTH